MHDLVIDNARPRSTASARPRAHGSLAVAGRTHRGDRRRRRRARRAARRRAGARARAGHRGHPHALRRPAHLGPVRHAVVVARRDHAWSSATAASPSRRAGPPTATSSLRNLTHVEGMSLEALRAGVNWDFETYPEYPRMRSSAAAWCRTSPRSSATPRCAPTCSATTPRKRAATEAEIGRDAAHRARGAARRRDRLRDLHARAAQRRERHPDALAPRRRARDARAHRRPRRGRARRVHADEGHDVDRSRGSSRSSPSAAAAP